MTKSKAHGLLPTASEAYSTKRGQPELRRTLEAEEKCNCINSLTHCQPSKLQRAKHRQGDRIQMLLWELSRCSLPGGNPTLFFLPGSTNKVLQLKGNQRRELEPCSFSTLTVSGSQEGSQESHWILSHGLVHHLGQKVSFPLHEVLSEEFVTVFWEYWYLKMFPPRDGSIENPLSPA